MIIDIRDALRYAEGHIEGAIHIPFYSLYANPQVYLNKGMTYQIYCDTGVKSSLLVSYLKNLGYHCVNLEGGYVKHLFK